VLLKLESAIRFRTNVSTWAVTGLLLMVLPAHAATFTTNPSSGQQLSTSFSYTGSGLSSNSTIQRWYQGPGQSAVRISDQTSLSNGTVTWSYTYVCSDPLGTWQNWIVDSKIGYTSAKVSNTVSAHSNCFEVSVSNASASVTQGQSATFNVTVRSLSGFAGSLSLSVLNLPGNQVLAGTGFSPQTVNVSANGTAPSTLTIVTNGSTPTGTANMTIQATSGTATKTASASLTVSGAYNPTFTTNVSSGQQLTTSFVLTGNGLTPNASIQRWYQRSGDSAVQLPTQTASGSGSITYPYTYQCSDAPGTWFNWIVDMSRGWTSPTVSHSVTQHPSCAAAFSISVSPSTATISQGQNATFVVTVQSQNAFSGSVVLDVLNLPGNQVLAGTGFSTKTVNVPSNGQITSTLTVVTNAATPTGTANMTVQGVNGAQTRTSPAQLNVNASAQPTFTTNPATGQQLTTKFTYSAAGLTPGGVVKRYYQSSTGPVITASDTTGDASGNRTWDYNYACSDAPDTWSNWITDVSKNWTSPKVTNTVSANPTCPVITSVLPATPLASLVDQTITINGSGFQNQAWIKVTYSGGSSELRPPGQVTFVSDKQLTALVRFSTAGVYGFQINNPDGNGGLVYNVTATAGSAPTLSAVNPVAPTVSGQNQTLTLTGTGFQSGASVNVTYPGGSGTLTGSQVSVVSTTSIQVQVLLNNPGAWSFRVTNPDGKQSGLLPVTVAAGNPTLSSGAAATQQNQSVKFTGGAYSANQSLQRWMTPPGKMINQLPDVSSNAQGLVSFDYAFGCSDPVGTYEFVLFDPARNQSSNIASVNLTANSSCQTTTEPTATINPPAGSRAGTFFAIKGTNFTPLGVVRLTLTRSGGTSLDFGQTTANFGGQIYYAWTADCKTAVDTYTLVATDAGKNKTAGAATVTITDDATCSTPGPKVSSVSPNPVPGLAQKQYFSIVGTALGLDTTVKLQGPQGTQTFTSAQADQVGSNRIVLQVAFGTTAGAWTATVSDASGSSSVQFQVLEGAAAPQISSSQRSGRQGTQFLTTGVQFTKNSQVDVFVKMPDGTIVPLGTANTDANGNVQNTYDSKLAPPGAQAIIFRDKTTGKTSNEVIRTINANYPERKLTSNVNSGSHGDPIDTSTGNYTYDKTDVALPGPGLPFRFTRYYNAQDPDGPVKIGRKWTHNFLSSATVSDQDSSVTINLPNGQVATFAYANGVYSPVYERTLHRLTGTPTSTLVLTTRSQIRYSYTAGRLVKIEDRNGNANVLTYAGENLTQITDSAGRQITLAYDGSGRIISVSAPPGPRTIRYAYDSSGNLVTVDDARGKRTTFTYDAAGRMLTGVDPEGITFVTNIYDDSGRVLQQSDGEGNTWKYAWAAAADGSTTTTTITDPDANTSTHIHDQFLRLITMRDSSSKETRYEYDANGNRTKVTDRLGHVTAFAYDERGNVTKMTDAAGNSNETTWNANNDPVSRKDALGNTTTLAYDARGNLTSVTDANGGVSTFIVNAAGQVTSNTDAEGRVITNVYDIAGNLTTTKDAANGQTNFTWDAGGRRLSSQDPLKFTTQFSWDENDNLISFTDPLSQKTDYTYDGNNHRTSVKDALGRVTGLSYDKNYQMKVATNALGGKVASTYDKRRNPATITDPLAHTRSYTYDAEGRLIKETTPAGVVNIFGYDAEGNRTSVTDGSARTTTTTFDVNNRPVSIADPLGSKTLMDYDAAGRVTALVDAAGNRTENTYDKLGRLTAVKNAASGITRFEYDRVGNRTAITDPRGKKTTFTWSAINQLLTVRDPLGNVVSNTWDAAGNLTTVQDGNGNTRAFTWDGNRRNTGITWTGGGVVTFTYDAVGNRTQMSDAIGTSKYTFDSLNRTTGYQHPLGTQFTFAFDAASNRTGVLYGPGKQATSTFDADNRLTSVRDWNNSQTGYAYDATGRVITMTQPNGVTATWAYDAAGQTTRIEYKKGSTSIYTETVAWSNNGNPINNDISGLTGAEFTPSTINYTYDDAGRLTATSLGPVGNDKNSNVVLMPAGSGNTAITYDQNNRATRLTGGGVEAQLRYFGDGRLAEMFTGGTARYIQDPMAANNRILAEVDAAGNVQTAYLYGVGMVSQIAAAGTQYFAHNLQGSTVALTDSGGAAVGTFRYDPFGRVVVNSASKSTSFLFLGRHSVPVVAGGYTMMTHRLYDAATGRFTGFDPAHYTLDVSLSGFVYGKQNPLSLIDPRGLWAETVLDGLSGFVAAGDIGVNIAKKAKFAPKVSKLIKGADKFLGQAGAALDIFDLGTSWYELNKAATSGGDVVASLHELRNKSASVLALQVVGLNPYTGTFAAGATLGNLAYKYNVLGTKSIADPLVGGVVRAGFAVTGNNFEDWSSKPNWLDDVDEPMKLVDQGLNKAGDWATSSFNAVSNWTFPW